MNRIVQAAAAALLWLIASAATAAPSTSHPRLWITPAEVPRLRQWAVAGNPVWQNGLRQLATNAATAMDAGTLTGQDNGGSTYSPVNLEADAAMFALLANVDPDPAARATWAQRGRTLLMFVLDRVDACMRATPPTTSGAYCSDSFPVSDRSRWQGIAFPLAVDWLYATTLPNGQPTLSTADKAKIRRVFLWWAYLNMEAYPNPYNNPPEFSVAVGTVGDPLLRLGVDPSRRRLRYGGNNYFAGHMRQLALMAIALDPADDVLDPLAPATYLKRDGNGDLVQYPFGDANGKLGGFLPAALDGWLFMQDYLLNNDSRGGMPPEGMEYAPTSIGIPAQFLLALETAGYADLAAQGQHGARIAALSTTPFYRDLLSGYLNSLSPVPFANPNRGMVYWPAWYGDGEFYYQDDSMNILGPLARHAMAVGDTRTADAVRWIQRNMPPRGSSGLAGRTRNEEDIIESLLYFLVFDPASPASAATAADPRPDYPTHHFAPGLGRFLARTDWGPDARWFSFKLGWNSVDHQHGDGLMIEFYRRGQWLTKSALGYGLEGGATDYENALSVQNNQWSGEDPESFIARLLRRGAQMPQGRASGDPPTPVVSDDPAYAYAGGDATALYNANYDAFDPTPAAQRATDVQHVSRSVLWRKPDHLVVYDRARTATANRSKRFWLNLPDTLPALPQVNGSTVTSVAPGNQRLFVTSVLPASKTLAIVTTDPEINLVRGNLWSLGAEDPILQHRQYVDPVSGQPVPNQFEYFATRLRIDATGGPADVRFLTVLQGADANGVRDATTAFASTAFGGCALPDGGYDGVVVGTSAMAFRRDLDGSAQCLEYTVAVGANDHTIANLAPYGAYTATRTVLGATQRIRLSAGGTLRADGAGVLHFDPTVLAAAGPRAVVDSERLDFAVLAVGGQRTRSFTLTNVGSAALSLAAFTVTPADAGYSLAGSCLPAGRSLAAGSSCMIDVRFAPLAAGFREAVLGVASDSTIALPTLRLTGLGEAVIGPTDLSFADGFE